MACYRDSFIFLHLKGTKFLEGLCINGRVVLMWILQKQWEKVDWIHLAQDIEPIGVFL
jgi:hypothetical protein